MKQLLKRIWYTVKPGVVWLVVLVILWMIALPLVSALLCLIAGKMPHHRAGYVICAVESLIVALGMRAAWDLGVEDRWRNSADLSKKGGK